MRTINNKQNSCKLAAPAAPAASSASSASSAPASATPSPSPAEPVPVPVPVPSSSTSTTSSASSSVQSSSKSFVANDVHSSTLPVFGTSSIDGIENSNTSNSNNPSNNTNRGEEIVPAPQTIRQKQQQQEQDFAVDDDDDDDDDDDHKSAFSWTGSDLDDDESDNNNNNYNNNNNNNALGLDDNVQEDEFIDDSTRFSTSVLGGDRSNISSNIHHCKNHNSSNDNDNEIKQQQRQQRQVDDQRDDGDAEIEQQRRENTSTIDIRDPVTPSGINDIAWSGSDLEDDCDENIVDSCHIIGTTKNNGLVTDDNHADTGKDSAAAAVTGRDSAAAEDDTDDNVIAWSKSDFDEDDDADVVNDDGDIAIKNLKDSININNNINSNIQIKDIAFLDDDVQKHSSASSVSVTARTTTTILESNDEDGKIFGETSSSSVTNRTGNSNTNHTYRTTGQHSATTAAMTNVTLMAKNDTDDVNDNNDGNDSLLEMSKSTHNNKMNGHVASKKEDSDQNDDNDDDHQTAYEEDLIDAFFENIHDRICKETSNSRGGKQIKRRRCNGLEEEDDDDVTVQDALFCKLLLDPMLDHLEKYDPVFEKLEDLACPEDDDDDDKTEMSNVEGVGIVDLDELSTMVCATTAAAKAEDGTAAPITNYAAIAFSQLLDRVERFDPYFERCTERMEEVFNSNDKKTNNEKEVNVDQQYSPRSTSSKATAASKISIDVLDKAFERAESMLKKQKQKAKIQKITGRAFERAELMLKKQKERWFVARVNWKLRQSVFSEAIKVNTKKCTEQTTKLVNECAAATITPATAAAAARAVVANATKCNDTTTDHRQTVTGRKKMDRKNKMEIKNSTPNPLKVEPPKNQLKSTDTEDGNESAVTDISYSDHVVRSQVGLSPGSSAGPSDEEEEDAETNFSEYDDDDTNTTMTGFLSESVVAGTTTGSLFVITEDVPVTESMVTCTSNMNKNEAKDGDSKKGNMTPSTPSSPLRRWAYPSPLPSPRRRCRKKSSASDNTPFAWLGQWRDSVESVSKKILDRTPSCSSTSMFFEDNEDNDLEKENSLIDHEYVGYVGYVGGSRDTIKVKEAMDGNDDELKDYDYDDDLSGFETAIDYDQQDERNPMPRVQGSRSSLLTENDYQQQDQDELHPMLRLQRSRDSLINENDYQQDHQDHQDERPPMLRLQRSRNSRGDHISLSSIDCDTATMKTCVSDYSRLSSLNGGAAGVVKDKIGYSLADSIRDASMTARNRDLRKNRMSREPRGNKLINEPSTHIHTISDQQRIRSPRSSETQITADLTATSGGSSDLLVTAIDESDNVSTKSSMIGYVKNLYHAAKTNADKTDGKEEDIRRQRNDSTSEHGSATSGIPSTSSTHTSAFMDCYEDEIQSNGYSMTSDMLSMATGLMSMTTDMMLNYNSSSKLSSSSNINRADNKNTDNNNSNNNKSNSSNNNSSNNNNNKEETESKMAPITTLPIEDDIPSDTISITTDMSMTTDMMLAYWNTSNGNNRDDDGELNLKPEPAPKTKAQTSPSSPTQTMTSTRTTMVYLEELIQSDATSPVKLVLYLAWLSVYYVIRPAFSTMVISVGSINDEDKNTNTVTVKSEENDNNEKEKKIIDTDTNTTACNDFKSDPAKNKKKSKRHRRHRRRPQTVEDRRRRRIRATRNFGKVLAGEPEDLSLSMSMSTTFTSSEELSASSSSSILYDLAHHHVDNMPSKPKTKKALILYV